MNARYYAPTLNRFLSADTIVPNSSNPQSLNRFSYTRNNPLKYVDPSGHKFEEIDEAPRCYNDSCRKVVANYQATQEVLNNLDTIGSSPGDFITPDLPGGGALFPDPGGSYIPTTSLQMLEQFIEHPDLFDNLPRGGTMLTQPDIRYLVNIFIEENRLRYQNSSLEVYVSINPAFDDNYSQVVIVKGDRRQITSVHFQYVEKVTDSQGNLHYRPVKSKWIRGMEE